MYAINRRDSVNQTKTAAPSLVFSLSRHLDWVLPFVLLSVGPALVGAADKVKVRVVKYPELAETIRQNKGKVIIVDFWAEWCIPCKREFPNLVKLHEQYAKDGLVALSVSLDDPHKEGVKEAIWKFLSARKASIINLVLDEPQDFWVKKFDTDSLPFVYVFDRDGKWQRFRGAEHYSEIQGLVVRLLNQE
jgi:thiol-disulfide isomerase/thioredoxin